MPQGARTRVVLGAAACLVAVAAVLGFTLVAGLIWPGTAVLEPCEAKVRHEHRGLDDVHVVRSQVHLRWLPPSWVCPLSNGGEVAP